MNKHNKTNKNLAKIMTAAMITSAATGCGTSKQIARQNNERINNLERELAQTKRHAAEMEFDIAWLQADLENMQSVAEMRGILVEMERVARAPITPKEKQAQLDAMNVRLNVLRNMIVMRDFETAIKCDSLLRVINEKQR